MISLIQITDIGAISLDVDGLGPLDWILEFLVNSLANSIRVNILTFFFEGEVIYTDYVICCSSVMTVSPFSKYRSLKHLLTNNSALFL